MPQRDPHSSTDVLDPIYKKLAALQAQVDSLQNLSIPTAPSYDSADFPQDSVEGQIAVGVNDNFFHWFVNGAWRTIPGVSWANWVSSAGTITPGGGSYQWLNGQYLETNDTDTFELGPSVSVGTTGLDKILLIKRQGIYLTIAFARFLTPIIASDEPLSSYMWGTWDSFWYSAGQLDTGFWSSEGILGVPGAPFGGVIRNRWRPWGTDFILYEDPITLPYMEYVPALFNSGGQNMTATSFLLTIRLSDSTPFSS